MRSPDNAVLRELTVFSTLRAEPMDKRQASETTNEQNPASGTPKRGNSYE